ncbi:SPOR domain-containing protein [Algiphilus sp.]|uniref:SPOR domain-containing protein n=1 Tax=Algiphilus sp. TaxID=1872431 RepID=UPI0025C50D6F|nr:SPOR domain-containing protein [Algiphilus sp.]MCK5770261.1 SPOR domain-containing protein [Algiphilus sp.]
MSDEVDKVLMRRLIGAVTVFGAAFLLSLLIPEPGAEREQDGAVVLRLDTPESVRTPGSDGASPAAPEARAARDAPDDRAAPSGPPQAEPREADAPPPRPAPQDEPSVAERTPPGAPDPQPATDPAPAASASSAGEWWVQAASYSDRETADAGQSRARAAGFRTRLRDVQVEGRRYWRLQVGAFGTEAEATRAARRLQDSGFAGARAFHEGSAGR